MASKKQKINPISAKSIKDSDKHLSGLVDSFITNKVTIDVTKNVTKKVTQIKKMCIGNKEITSTEKKDLIII